MTSKGQIAEQNTNEYVLVIAHVTYASFKQLNTEARFFDHFLNFPNRANVHTYIIVFHDAYVTHQHLWPG